MALYQVRSCRRSKLQASLLNLSYLPVFLRAVEYYKGILFLTTNRVGQFDDAFISRIHVVLRYENLNQEDRKKIWEGFFDKLERERGRQLRITKHARNYIFQDEEMQSIPWNGREIRNGKSLSLHTRTNMTSSFGRLTK